MPVRILILVLLAMTAVSGCGRRGGLEEPGAATVGESTSPAPAGTGTSPLDPGSPVAPPAVISEPAPQPVPKRRFFLDFLL